MQLPKHIEKAIWEYVPVLEGWNTPERSCEMAAVIIETKPEIVVEIGVFAGRSLISMAFGLRDNNKGMIYGLDAWKVDAATEGDTVEESREWWKNKSDLERMHQLTMKAIWDHKLEKWATIIRACSQDVIQLFPLIDVLNIDGCHSEVSSCRDVELYLPRVRSGGIVFMDDTNWDSTQKAIGMIEQQCEQISDNGKARTYRKR